MLTGLSGDSSSVEESVTSAVGVAPLAFDVLGLLNHLVMVLGNKPDILAVTFFTNDCKRDTEA